MKLMGRCQRCDRDLLLEQLLLPGGTPRCPWCGAGLARDYATLLYRVVPEVERAGRELARNLRVLAGDWTGIDLDERSVLGPIQQALERARDEREPAKVKLSRANLRTDRRAA